MTRPADDAPLAERLDWVADEFESLADLVEYDRGSGPGSRAQTREDIAFAQRAISEAKAKL